MNVHLSLPVTSSGALERTLRRIPSWIGWLLDAETPANPKPDWARVSDRVWQRHSAYLTQMREQQLAQQRRLH